MSVLRPGIAAALLLTACGGEAERPVVAAAEPPVATTGEPDFVGSDACAGCHAGEAERWRDSHHDLAMQEATDATVLGDFDGAHLDHPAGRASGGRTSFARSGDGFVLRTESPDGEPREYEVAYAFGVDPLQQLLVRLPGGRLQAPTVAWDTRAQADGGQRWIHLQPDEAVAADDPLHWTGLAYNWNHMCAECHSTGVRKGYDEASDRFETTWAEIDVACEACHGRGSAHVAWARAGGGGDPQLAAHFPSSGEWRFAPDATIAHRVPALDSRAELETCGRCHARRSLLHEDPTPGRPLADTHLPALLDEGLYHADGQIEDEVYVYGSFLQSRMADAGVSCSDCHDPHSLALRAPGNALCGRCHDPATFDAPTHHFHPTASAGARCVECHMPATTYMQVDPRRDHSFRVPRPDLSLSLGVPNACSGCHAGRSAAWADAAVRDWYGESTARPHYGEALHAGRGGREGARPALLALAGDADQPAIARATAIRLLAALPSPETDAAMARAARDDDPLLRLAAAGSAESLEPAERLRLVRPLLEDPIRAVRLEAARSLASVPPERWPPGSRAAFADAVAEYRAAQSLNADRPEAHVNRGSLDATFGEIPRARASYERAIELAPWFVPAHVNLADALRREGRDDEGERALRRGLEVTPDDPSLHHALGLLLVRVERREEALASLARAAELAPDEPRLAYVYAVALHSAGNPGRAIAVLEEAHGRRPGDPELLLGLATLERDRGRRVQALGWAEKLVEAAPGPQTRGLRDQLANPSASGPPGG